MSNLPKSNPELDRVINEARTPQELREAMLSTMAQQGTIVRSRDDEFNNRLILRPTTPDPNQPGTGSGFRFERELKFHPDSGKQSLVLRANTIADLDRLEAQILNY